MRNILIHKATNQPKIYNRSGNGNIYPALRENSLLKKWSEFEFGLFPHWGFATFTETETYYPNANNPIPHPSIFTPPANINTKIEAMVDYCKDVLQADYITMTATHNYGFTLWPSQVEFNGGVQISSFDQTRATNVVRPQHLNFGVNHPDLVNNVSQTIIEAFVNRCRQKNIEPVLYYNLGKGLNYDWAHQEPESAYDESGNYPDYHAAWYNYGYDYANSQYPELTGTYAQHYQKQIDFVTAQMTELINLTDCQFFWMDSPYNYPRAHLQKFYNDIKAQRDVMLICNEKPIPVPGGTMYPTGVQTDYMSYSFTGDIWQFPFDIACIEYAFKPGNPTEVSNYNRPYRGLDYYVPSEVCYSGGPTFHWETGWTPWSVSKLQEVYDYARNNGAPCSIALAPDQNGDILQTQKDSLEAIVR